MRRRQHAAAWLAAAILLVADAAGLLEELTARVPPPGADVVAKYLERRAGADPEVRWGEFARLISSPRLPSGLTE